MRQVYFLVKAPFQLRLPGEITSVNPLSRFYATFRRRPCVRYWILCLRDSSSNFNVSFFWCNFMSLKWRLIFTVFLIRMICMINKWSIYSHNFNEKCKIYLMFYLTCIRNNGIVICHLVSKSVWVNAQWRFDYSENIHPFDFYLPHNSFDSRWSRLLKIIIIFIIVNLCFVWNKLNTALYYFIVEIACL